VSPSAAGLAADPQTTQQTCIRQEDSTMLYPTLWNRQSPNVWDEIFTIRDEFDRLLGRRDTQVTSGWCPVVDVRETTNELVLQAELPGISPDDVDVSVENGVLSITGEKRAEVREGEEGGDFHLVERRYGRFERRFTLPRSVDAEKVSAEFRDGLLTVTLPKAEAAKPRRIEVKAIAK
jgi:HSP20 family protein